MTTQPLTLVCSTATLFGGSMPRSTKVSINRNAVANVAGDLSKTLAFVQN